ncbi:MAG TPA: AMP-binding protein [Steroidobacteraceae bacterium]|nr:AMP-binding protein [Steroidobacteraceae bacterium]
MTAPDAPAGADTVAAAFAASVARYGQHDFLEVLPEVAAALGVEARTWSYAQAAREVARLQQAYAAAGYGHGHRAGLLLLNRPEFLFHFVALNALGVSVVPISPEWRSAELEYLIAHSEICVVASIPERTAALQLAARNCGRELAVTDPAGSAIPAAPGAAPEVGRAPDADSECALLYTSGTTGRPKGCVLPNEYFLVAGRWYTQVGGLCEVRPGVERLLTPLPMMHMNAMACSTLCMILAGGCLVLLDRFHPRSWWPSVRQSRATIVHYLGVMPAILLADAPTPEDRHHSVRFGFGAGVNPRHHAAFEVRFGFPLLEAWAMTETGAGAVIIANREPRHVGTACIGVASPQVQCRIVDESGADVAPGVAGELLVRHAGPRPRYGFFRCYLKDEAATQEAWSGGWFHTGDLVTRDAQGVMRFVDRRKNIIRRSGENISAVEVEAVLAQHPQVRTAAVTAVPDELRGDEVFACIVLKEAGAERVRLAEELASLCRERLAYYKAPGYIAFCSALPLTPTEKVQRSELRELARALLERGDCLDLRAHKRREAS